jgi:hypothetical protein
VTTELRRYARPPVYHRHPTPTSEHRREKPVASSCEP